jgi:outer membrane protein assembly factor BamB
MNATVRAGVGALLVGIVLLGGACGGDSSDEGEPAEVVGSDLGLPGEWPTFAQNLERTGFNSDETKLTKENADRLVVKWRFATDGPVAASPVAATVEVPSEGPVRVVIAGSYDGNVYAIRADDGSELWRYAVKPHPGVSYGAIVASAHLAEIDGEPRVFIGGGETMYAIHAGTGELVWEFDAGTGCTTCTADEERNEILSSAAVLPERDMVLFGMDVNDSDPGKGGFYALSARDGRMRWYFDLETGATCRPDPEDNVRKFDGFHSAEELGLAADFFETREGCGFDRTETGCGSVWSSPSVDRARELIYFASSNCDTDEDPTTAEPPPPMPRYDEALVVLNYDGTPDWTWRPREIDNDDLAFGAAPNLFTARIQDANGNAQDREVVGIGGKDGTYYLLDRDGENEVNGNVEPYWQLRVVQGGAIGGLTGTPSTAQGRVVFGTAIGESVEEWQTPSAWAIDVASGQVAWSQEDAAPFYGATSTVPGLAFMGGVDTLLRVFDSATGDVLASFPLEGLAFSQAAIVDGVVYVGSGFGADEGATANEEAQERAQIAAAIWAFCIEGQEGCASASPTPTP